MDKEKINNELKAHREYVVNRVGAPLNWSGEDLRMADLKEVDFRKANLSGADLTGADLRRANFTDTKFTGADLTGANLTGADLSDVSFTGDDRADLTGANFTGADLCMADLRGADLRGANFSGADLTGANLTNADLRRANFTGAYLTGAKLIELSSLYRVAGDGERIISIKNCGYFIAVTDHQLQIGCKIGTHEQWKDEPWRVENLLPDDRERYLRKESALWEMVDSLLGR